jgi:hypothetical protein
VVAEAWDELIRDARNGNCANRVRRNSIVRRDGGCSTTKTERSVVPERIVL